MDQIINALGALGAYFAVVLVLAVAVESVLDTVKLGGLLRSRISPEQAMKDVAAWLPDQESQKKAQIAAITNMVSQFKVTAEQIEKQVEQANEIGQKVAEAIGLGNAATELEKRLAATLLAVRQKYVEDEARRVSTLRILSALCGIPLAVVLQIDTFQLLAGLFPQSFQDFLNSGTTLATVAHYGGMALTGFASSAGSSFWHDQLDRVRAAKDAARKAKEAFS
ncbi:MAG: hypothetical protein ACRENG_25480 [bacterium]